MVQLEWYLFFLKISKIATSDVVSMETRRNTEKEMHFQYTVFGPLDVFHGFIQICYYECPHISGIYLESLLNVRLAGEHLYEKLLFTWLSLVMSMMVSFCAALFPTRCLG